RWSRDQAPNVSYELTISTFHSEEPPPPLTIGPGPGIRIRHVTQSGVIAPVPPAPTVEKALEIPKVPAAPLALPFRDSHVVLASASAPDLSAMNIDAGSPSELGRIPSGVFLALGAGPAPGISVGLPMEAQ